MAASILARVIAPFVGWDRLEDVSSNIIIVYCGGPTPPTPGFSIVGATRFDSEITVISILKGTNHISSGRLQTDHELRQNNYYLAFADYDNGIYEAWEEYKVVPLGTDFSTNLITGKPLNDQLQVLFCSATNTLDHEIEMDEQDKSRLEQGISGTTN